MERYFEPKEGTVDIKSSFEPKEGILLDGKEISLPNDPSDGWTNNNNNNNNKNNNNNNNNENENKNENENNNNHKNSNNNNNSASHLPRSKYSTFTEESVSLWLLRALSKMLNIFITA